MFLGLLALGDHLAEHRLERDGPAPLLCSLPLEVIQPSLKPSSKIGTL